MKFLIDLPLRCRLLLLVAVPLVFQDIRLYTDNQKRKLKKTFGKRCLPSTQSQPAFILSLPSSFPHVHRKAFQRALILISEEKVRYLSLQTGHDVLAPPFCFMSDLPQTWDRVFQVAAILDCQHLFDMIVQLIDFRTAFLSFKTLYSMNKIVWSQQLVLTFFPIPYVDLDILVQLTNHMTPEQFFEFIPTSVSNLVDFWDRFYPSASLFRPFPIRCCVCGHRHKRYSPVFGPLKQIEILYCCGEICCVPCYATLMERDGEYTLCVNCQSPAWDHDRIMVEVQYDLPRVPERDLTHKPWILSPAQPYEPSLFSFPWREWTD